MSRLDFDIAHLLAGLLVLISFLELYQDRLYALLNTYALHALVLAASVAWQAFVQDAPHLYVTAAIALLFKAMVIPISLHRIIVRLGIHRQIEKVVGVGPAMLAGMGLVALSMVVMLRVNSWCRSAGARRPRLRPFGGAARPVDDGDAKECGQPGHWLYVAREWTRAGGNWRQGHASRR